MYDMYIQENIVNQDQMEIIKNSGTKIILKDNDVEVTVYLYNDRVYVYDVKEINT